MAKTTRPRKATPAKRQPTPVPEPTPGAALADMERDANEQAEKARAAAASAAADERETETPAESAPKRVKNSRLCPVVNCERLGHDHLLGLCGAHYASRRGDHV